MPRYIDADELWNDRPQFPSGQDAEYDAGFCDCYLAFSELIRKHIDNTTADVVPKSEVEELNMECESLGKTVNEASELIHKLKGKVEEAKAEVAREIFEEIYEDCFDQFGYIDYEKLAELKKKYTEGG